MYKIAVFVPNDYTESVKEAMFDAGGGCIDSYDHCCFETSGRGQFRPCEGSQPFIGVLGAIEFVDETKIEMVCNDPVINEVISALKKAHPYETPAYDVIRLEDI